MGLKYDIRELCFSFGFYLTIIGLLLLLVFAVRFAFAMLVPPSYYSPDASYPDVQVLHFPIVSQRQIPTEPETTVSSDEVISSVFSQKSSPDLSMAPVVNTTMVSPTTVNNTTSSTSSPKKSRAISKRVAMSELFLKELRAKAIETILDLHEAEKYCLPPSTLANCELDWSKLISNAKSNGEYFNFTSSNNDTNERCFKAQNELTCFASFNGTHYEVKISRLEYTVGTLDVEIVSEPSIYARHVLALSPEDYILVTGDTPDQFCLLSIFDATCQTYAAMIDALI